MNTPTLCYCKEKEGAHKPHYLAGHYRCEDKPEVLAVTWTDGKGENWNNGPWVDIRQINHDEGRPDARLYALVSAAMDYGCNPADSKKKFDDAFNEADHFVRELIKQLAEAVTERDQNFRLCQKHKIQLNEAHLAHDMAEVEAADAITGLQIQLASANEKNRTLQLVNKTLDEQVDILLEQRDTLSKKLAHYERAAALRQERCNQLQGEGVTATFCHYSKPCPIHPEKTWKIENKD